MKKLLLVVLIAAIAFVLYRNYQMSEPEPPDLTTPQGAAEFFFDAAMAADEAKIRQICADDREESLLRYARDLRGAIPPEKRGSSFMWQKTSTETGEDMAYTGKIGNVLFFIGLRQEGNEYRVCRVLIGE